MNKPKPTQSKRKKKWNWEKRKDNYPHEKWGKYWSYQKLVYNDKIFQSHKRYNHTDGCKFYVPESFVIICRITGDKIISDLERLNC